MDLEAQTPSRKRKRKRENDNLEGDYMRKLAEAEIREATRLKLHQQPKGGSDDEVDNEASQAPQHESLTKGQEDTGDDIEKASRTVFLGNVSVNAIASKNAKKELLRHLSSFFPELATPGEGEEAHKIESIRFRSTPFATQGVPKKAAYARKELKPETTKGTNAYVIYSTTAATREAVRRLNGTIVLDRHLRVDSVAHPAKVDHKRCVFVGNLGFVDEVAEEPEDDEEGEGHKKRRKKKASNADVEEGLWRQFSKAGTVESVRVIRDAATRVSKGFAYVQFKSPDAVEAALLYHDSRFPPLLPRKLRVSRARKVPKSGSRPSPSSRENGLSRRPGFNQATKAGSRAGAVYIPKPSSAELSLQGRAGHLLGRAGAARLRQQGHHSAANKSSSAGHDQGGKPLTTDAAFEGHRASAAERPKLKQRGNKRGKSASKPSKKSVRSRERAKAWKTDAVGKARH